MQFTQRFTDAQEAWKKDQSQYAELISAIKRETKTEDLRPLMADAGVGIEEANGLLALRRQALAYRQEAGQYGPAKKAAERLNREWETLDRELNTAKTLVEQDAAAEKLAELEGPRRDANRLLCETKLAADRVQLATELGLI